MWIIITVLGHKERIITVLGAQMGPNYFLGYTVVGFINMLGGIEGYFGGPHFILC